MDAKKISLIGLGGLMLVGCTTQQAAETVVAHKDTIETGADASGIPYAGLIAKAAVGLAGLYLTYKTGIHKPVLGATGSAIGHVGDLITGTTSVASGGIGGVFQHVEDLLKKYSA